MIDNIREKKNPESKQSVDDYKEYQFSVQNVLPIQILLLHIKSFTQIVMTINAQYIN